jgi:nicotinate-nucleotide pyrophosphorylase (carboxylating)
MVKDTHVDLLGGMEAALNKLPDEFAKTMPVIVEVRTSQELVVLLERGLGKVTRVLLDNMPLDLMRECVALCHGILPTEASGNVNIENVVSVAETGVDFISIGKLTHSAGNVDLSMKCDINYV